MAQGLPVVLHPYHGESLYGFTLRLDDANDIPAGTVARLISGEGRGPGRRAEASYQFAANLYDLELLGALAETPRRAIEALTYRRQLQRLFGPDAAGRRVGRGVQFRVCPSCIRERRFVSLEAALPLLTTCPEHQVQLVAECTACSRLLIPFDTRGYPPFICRCGLAWEDNQSHPLPPPDRPTQRRVVRAYRWIFANLPTDLEGAARHLAREIPEHRFEGGYELMRDDPAWAEPRYFASVSSVVALLVARNYHPSRLLEIDSPALEPRHACLNLECRADAGSIRKNGVYSGELETYCAECGSRFRGGRIILSFDRDHGDPTLSPRAVTRARARLVGWRMRLRHAAAEMMAERPASQIEIRDVFERAGVPTAGYLRARKLRLVPTVKAVLRGWEGPYFGDAYAEIDRRWRHPSPPLQRVAYRASPRYPRRPA